jgi:phosphopentomutase
MNSAHRAAIIVLDSVGCGGAPDAAAFGDGGADTLGHIAIACAAGKADREGLRKGKLHLPHLARLGLGLACRSATGAIPPGLETQAPQGLYGSAVEVSIGKDTPSGHWEIVGTPVPFAWGYFPQTIPAFPAALTKAIIEEGRLPGIIGDRHASGTAIIDALGAEHVSSGKPICYTSVDSVLQIAAHEEAFGLERLYDLCRVVRRLVDPLMIGRVIARPFVGDAASGFQRTANRKDFAIPAPAGNLLDRAAEAGRDIVSVGKIGDIFGHRHTGREVKAAGNMKLFDAMLEAWRNLADGGFLFANFVDFDTEFGHRRDVAGYAHCLEEFDARLPELISALRPGDLVIITADHGNDPTFRGTDHTREQIPIIGFSPGMTPRPVGRRRSFADIGQSIASHLGLEPVVKGESFLSPADPAPD